MPYNPGLPKQEDIQTMKERYQVKNKEITKFFWKVWADIEYNAEIKNITNTHYTKKRYYTITGCELTESTANYHQRNSTGQNH